jgi:hypothetical protein
MSLPLPTPLITSGPAWATLLNSAFTIVDGHNHSSIGSRITTAAISIDADFSLNQFSMNSVTSFSFYDQSGTLAGNSRLYSVNGLLYFNSGAGTPIQITTVSGINIASVGTIGGDFGQPGVTASAEYSDTTKTFLWSQAPGVTAKFYMGSLSIANETAGANAVTRTAASGTASYTLTYPVAAPAAGSVEVFDGSGVATFKVPTGTTNQVTITSTAGALTFSLPQNINTAGSPTFAGLTLTNFSGVVKAASGVMSASAIVNADIDASAAIADTKLATISTAGKVANSATTATSANTASAIVTRDASGNFSAGTVTATFSGNLTGNITGNVSGNSATTDGVKESSGTTLKYKVITTTAATSGTQKVVSHGLDLDNIVALHGVMNTGSNAFTIPSYTSASEYQLLRATPTDIVLQGAGYSGSGYTVTIVITYV